MGVFGRIRDSLSRTKQQIVERFDESAAMIQWKLGWPIRPLTSENVSPRGMAREISEEDRATIRRFNALDYELYDFAAKRFAAEVEQGGDFDAQRKRAPRR